MPTKKRKLSRSPSPRSRRSGSNERTKVRDKVSKRKRSRSRDRKRRRKREDRHRTRSKSTSPDNRTCRPKLRSRDRDQKRERRRRSSRSRSRSTERRKHHRDAEERKTNKAKEVENDHKKERVHKSSRSRSRSAEKCRHNRDAQVNEVSDDAKKEIKPTKTDEIAEKEIEQQKLELEIQKRRERVEKWRSKRQKLDQQENDKSKISIPPVKKWSLEDDEEEITKESYKNKEETKAYVNNDQLKKDESEDEEDPLDAFMHNLHNDMIKTGQQVEKQKGKVTMMCGIAKKREINKKGELIEQDQDALEYSSEEENEDLKSAMTGLQKKQQKKTLQVVNHNQIEYQPFRKDFYVEVPELAKMNNSEVDAYRAELEGIRIKGKNCPKPIKSWAHCGVSKKVLDILIKKQKYEKPTPIQCQAIPVLMSGRDMIGIAKTGSGKTLAFILPMFRHILDQPQLENGDGPISIIMTPTRELALQIVKECRKFTKYLDLRVVCVYGGTGISEQIADLKRGAEIVVCTPGRMIDMLAANSGRVTNLRRCTYLVLDEADRMFDMGFESQVMRILDNIRPDRQTLMFSATFPRQMEALARRVLIKPIEVQVGGRSIVCKEVEQNVIVIEEDAKFLKLLELLGFYQDSGSILVFVQTQENADSLLKNLMTASYPCMALHGGIDQCDRDSTMVDFKSGVVNLLVATSVAARGLDVKQLILVINYDCPNHYEDYVHRCGRTGRAGNKGFAYTFITTEQGNYAIDVVKALKLSEVAVPDDVQRLSDEYKAKQQAEGKKAKGGSGFCGKGFKFDEAEAQFGNEKIKMQKAIMMFQDSDEDLVDDDIEQQIETMLAPKLSVKEVIPSAINSTGSIVSSMEKLEMAKLCASKINMGINKEVDSHQQAVEAVMKGTLAYSNVSAKAVAEQLLEKLNAKLNYQPKFGVEKDCDDVQVKVLKKYEEELEINDFPQKVRWKVTCKETLAEISEYSEAGVSVRGTYYPGGKQAKSCERKLYLCIESSNETAVSKAKAEITRLIKEELIKLQNSNLSTVNRGRYKVL